MMLYLGVATLGLAEKRFSVNRDALRDDVVVVRKIDDISRQ
jgi:hypothetical protein